jgi:hypothetical protein
MDHKRGDSFDYVTTIPTTFADGYFVGWTVAAQVRNAKTDALVASLTATWVDAATTRALKLLHIDTSAWPLGPMEMDVQFTRTSDGYTLSTSTVQFNTIKDVTRT